MELLVVGEGCASRLEISTKANASVTGVFSILRFEDETDPSDMVGDLRDAIQMLEEASRRRNGSESLRHAYVTANASRIGRFIAMWTAFKAAVGRERTSEPLPVITLPPEPRRPDERGIELREAATRQREQLQNEIARLSRGLAEARALTNVVTGERDAERVRSAELRRRLERMRVYADEARRSRISAQLHLERLRREIEPVAGELSTERALAAALRETEEVLRERVERLQDRLDLLQAVVHRERRSARAALALNRTLAEQAELVDHADEKRDLLRAALQKSEAVLNTAQPDVTVIVPAYEQAAMTVDCIQSIANAIEPGDPTMQVIVVDDASPSEALSKALFGLPFVTYLRNGNNLGFLRSCNGASMQAKGRFLHFLNNDTLVRPGWLRELVHCADADGTIGAVGSKLLFEDGSLQEAGGIIWRDGGGWNYGRGGDAEEPRFNYLRDVDYCSGASLLVRADLFRELGRFNEIYAPAYFEDSDLCFAIRASGRRVLYQPKSEVVHLEGVSSGTSTESGVKRHQASNQPKFIARWSSELENHYAPDSVPGIVAARRLQAPKTLVMIDNYVPEYDKDSGSNKLYNFIQLFMKLGYNVIYVPDNFHRSEPYTTTLQNLGVEVLYECDGQPHLEVALRERLSFADIVWMGRPELADKYIPIVREFPQLPILYDTHDLHYVRMRRELELKGVEDPLRWAAWVRARDLELSVVRRVDVAMTVTDVERTVLEEAGMDNVFVVTNVHDSFPRVTPYERTSGIIFIGGYVHSPNVDAVLWLCEEIMPIVWRSHPDMKVTLIGSNAPEEVRALASSRVYVPGFVHDVTIFFQQARLMVAPLRYGAGLKGKIGHAFAYGLPTVTTTIGAEGFDIVNGRDALVADDAEGLANALIRAYDDRELWETLSANATRIVERYSPEATERRLATALEMGFRRRAESLLVATA